MEEIIAETIIRDYLDAFEARDLTRCVDFYNDDATLTFQTGVYRGRQAIERWHRDRFAADLRILEVDDTQIGPDEATVDATISSKKLRAWKINSLGSSLRFEFEAGKITSAKFGIRL